MGPQNTTATKSRKAATPAPAQVHSNAKQGAQFSNEVDKEKNRRLRQAKPGVTIGEVVGAKPASNGGPTIEAAEKMKAANADKAKVLGTSRTLVLDTSKGLEVGIRFKNRLSLGRKEVVLTFDDGPRAKVSEKVLKALNRQEVRATFFLVGQNARANPGLVRAIAAGGHTIGTHTWSHPYMSKKPLPEAMSQIDRGFAAVNAALKRPPGQVKTGSKKPPNQKAAPFFRFPGLESNLAMRAALKKRGIGAFDIDIEGGDWIRNRTSADVYNRVITQLKQKQRGIILLHDIQPRTAAMVPALLRYLKNNNYKIVHIVPKPIKPQDPKTSDMVAVRNHTAQSKKA